MTVVVGFVADAEGQAALEFAIEEAKYREETLVVVHSSVGGADEEPEGIEWYRQQFNQLETRLHSVGVEYRLRRLARGNTPAEDLVGVCREEGARLVVVGLRRRSPVGKALLGSDAQAVLLDAPCPVVAVKAGV